MAIPKVYEGDIGVEILIDCQRDLSAGTDPKIKVKKPNGEEVEWIATVYQSEYIRYVTLAGDLNLDGSYSLQPFINLAPFEGRGKTVHFHVAEKFE
jgi:hypothetical protein